MLRRIARRLLGRSGQADPAAESSTDASPPESSIRPTPSQDAARCKLADLSTLEAAITGAGPVRLIQHWATWCAGCIEELPMLQEVHARVGSQVTFIGVSWDGFQGGQTRSGLLQTVDAFILERDINWDSLVVDVHPDQFFEALDMSCRTVPQIWLVDATGRVVHREESVLSAADIDTLIDHIEAI